MNGSAPCTIVGVSAVTITRRTSECSGGSSSPRMRSSNGITTPGAFIPDAFENDVVSRMTARHSAQRVTYGSPPATAATGLASRSAAEQRPRFLALAAERVELGRVGHARILTNVPLPHELAELEDRSHERRGRVGRRASARRHEWPEHDRQQPQAGRPPRLHGRDGRRVREVAAVRASRDRRAASPAA